MGMRAENSSIRRADRAPSALAAAALMCVLGASASDSSRSDESEVLDLTDDLYHRIKAGLFSPASEPLVLRLRKMEPSLGAPVPDEYVTFTRDEGSFAVRTDERGAVVVHLDVEAALSHLKVSAGPEYGIVREFEEDPRHPIR